MNQGPRKFSRHKRKFNEPFNPKLYIQNKEKEIAHSKTTFVNPEVERLEKELKLLKEQKQAITSTNKEKTKPEEKVVVINGEKYLQTQTELKRVCSQSKPINKSNSVCLHFCKYGSCSKSPCPYVHDRSLVRICPSYMRGCCTNENCTLNHTPNPNLIPLCTFFLKGNCKNKDCNYRHEKIPDTVPVCKDFDAGYCKEGKNCKFKHIYSTKDKTPKKSEENNVSLFLPSFIKLDKSTTS